MSKNESIKVNDFFSLPQINISLCPITKSILEQFCILDKFYNGEASKYFYKPESEHPVFLKIYEKLKHFMKLDEKAKNTIYASVDSKIDNSIWVGTYNHSFEVSMIVEYVAKNLQLPEYLQQYMCISSILHDIGKQQIPIEICGYMGNLREKNMYWQIMQKHTYYGARELAKDNWISAYAIAAEFHHKFLDGKGYPGNKGESESLYKIIVSGKYADLLKKANIPIEDAMLTIAVLKVCDIFAALCSKRAYRPAMKIDKAMKITVENELALVGDNIKRCYKTLAKFQDKGKTINLSDVVRRLVCKVCIYEQEETQMAKRASIDAQLAIYDIIAVEVLCKQLTPELYRELTASLVSTVPTHKRDQDMDRDDSKGDRLCKFICVN